MRPCTEKPMYLFICNTHFGLTLEFLQRHASYDFNQSSYLSFVNPFSKLTSGAFNCVFYLKKDSFRRENQN